MFVLMWENQILDYCTAAAQRTRAFTSTVASSVHGTKVHLGDDTVTAKQAEIWKESGQGLKTRHSGRRQDVGGVWRSGNP